AGKLRGLGIATVIENTGAGLFNKDQVEIEVTAAGEIHAYTVSHSQGQGHETAFGQIVADTLGVSQEHVKIRRGGKARVGNHTGGSRSTVGAGSAMKLAAQKVIEQGKSIAAEVLEAEPSQMEYSKGTFQVRGTRKKIGLIELSKKRPFTVMGEGSFGS